MRLQWIELRDFRNHAHTRIDPIPEGLLVAVGANGEGKTNLFEAMHFLYALESPRASASEPLVRRGAEAGYVRGEFLTEGGKVLVEVEVRARGANKVQVNRSPIRRKRDLRKQIRSIMFGPFDLPVITGDPARRRSFMDEVVVALVPASDTLTSTYERVLRQRNRLLKEHDGRGAPPGLEAWDEQLIQTGTAVTEARAAAVMAIAPPASETFEDIAGYPLLVRYAPNVQAGRGCGRVLPDTARRAARRRAPAPILARGPPSRRPRARRARAGGSRVRQPRGDLGGGGVASSRARRRRAGRDRRAPAGGGGRPVQRP